jgi:hypothetical protein
VSIRLAAIASCEICRATQEFDATKEIAAAAREAGWYLPGFGGTLCPRCGAAVKRLTEGSPK